VLPNVGFPELILLLAIALLVFGPQRLAGMGTALGRAIREFRRGLQEPDQDRPDSEPRA
jgi:sec-independent protein translocase protein TatA